MGLLYKPIGISGFPFDFIAQFVKDGYNVCVETGTFLGGTAIQMSRYFDRVYTIEASDYYFSVAKQNVENENIKNITMLYGDTIKCLPQVLETEKDSKIVFWLDAHYSGGETFFNVSPLMREIEIINTIMGTSPILIIDDARFINMKYNDETRYANLYDFIVGLHYGNRYISCYQDQYVAVPAQYQNSVDEFTRNTAKDDAEFMNSFHIADSRRKEWSVSRVLNKWRRSIAKRI